MVSFFTDALHIEFWFMTFLFLSPIKEKKISYCRNEINTLNVLVAKMALALSIFNIILDLICVVIRILDYLFK